jgi:hypothetical protein
VKSKKFEQFNISYTFVFAMTLVCLFLYCYNVPAEHTIGSDDYRFSRAIAKYGMWNVFPDAYNYGGIINWVEMNFNILFGDHHGVFPGLYLGPLLKLLDLFGVPVSFELLGFPNALHALLACVLFYFLLVKSKFPVAIAIMGTMTLMVSPILNLWARSVAGYFLVMVPLTQVVSLYALKNVTKNKNTQYITGFCLAFASLGDTLFFISVLILLAARLSFSPENISCKRGFLDRCSKFCSHNSNLLNMRVLLPPATVFAVYFLVSLIIEYYGMKEAFSPLLRAIVHGKASGGGSLLLSNPTRLDDYLLMLFGEGMGFILAVALISLVVFFRQKIAGNFLAKYAGLAGIVFGGIFYVFQPYQYSINTSYQIYLMIPLLLLILLFVRELYLSKPIFKKPALIILGILLISSGAANGGIIWRKPLLLLREYDFIENYYALDHGRVYRSRGAKAAGFIVRETLESIAGKEPNPVVNIYSNDEYRSAFYNFAGLQMDGLSRYKIENNMEVSFNYRDSYAGLLPNTVAVETAYFGVVEIIDKTRGSENAVSGPSKKPKNIYRYEIISESRPVFTLLLLSERNGSNFPFKPGSYQAETLEESFDKQYHRLNDFVYEF